MPSILSISKASSASLPSTRPGRPTPRRRAVRRRLGMPAAALLVLSLPLLVIPAVAAPAAAASRDPESRARELFHVGEAHFIAGRYREAALAYERAYAAKPLAGFLFNLGQCYRNLDRPVRALSYFKAYLLDAPHAANRAAVQRTIADLDALLDKEQSGSRSERIAVSGTRAPPAPAPSPVSDIVEPREWGPDETSVVRIAPPGLPEPIAGAKGVAEGDPLADTVRAPRTAIRPESDLHGASPVLPRPTAPALAWADVTASVRRAPARTPVYRRWWFWTLVGVAAAGAVATGVLASHAASPGASIGEGQLHRFGGSL
jgi:hypothetical protein